MNNSFVKKFQIIIQWIKNTNNEPMNERIYYRMNISFLVRTTSWTFCRKALWEPLDISTVVINHVFPLHPPHPPVTHWVHFLIYPSIVRYWNCFQSIAGATRAPSRDDTSIGPVVLVVRSEWCLSPISLDSSSHCCPIISIPEAGVHPHGLIFRESNSSLLHVLEISYWYVINHESAWR